MGVLPLLSLAPVIVEAQVAGTVFRDYNANGTRDAYEGGVSSVTVTAYFNGTTSSAVSTTAGSYSFSAVQIPSSTPVRLEFSGLPTNTFSGPFSAAAAGNGTSVQFVTAGPAATTVNFAVNLPIEYCQANPPITIPCYENGLRTTNSNPGLVAFNYNSSNTTGTKTTNATISQAGAVWGTDYQVTQKRLFAGGFLKRHVDLGGQGLGGFLVLDYTASATSPASSTFTLQGVTPANGGPALDAGSVNRTVANGPVAAANFQLSAASTTPNIDLDAYEKVGTVGFGDVDLDETKNTLWTLNLNQRSLVNVTVNGAAIPGAVNQYLLASLPGYPTPATYTNSATTNTRIEVGGTALIDANGNTFLADVTTPGVFTVTGGSVVASATTITNLGNSYESTSSSQLLYQTVRTGASFAYAIPVVNGRYRVDMHLSDPFSTTAGQRLTTATVESYTALSAFDTWASRAAVANRATTAQVVVDVTDGLLNLGFIGGGTSGSAVVAGLEITPITSGVSGEMRPWGIGFQNGKGYLGVISDASNSLRRADLQAYVLQFDPTNVAAGFTTALSFPLTYTRENTNATTLPGHWTAWRSQITMLGDVADPSFRRTAPTPLISDIDFTENGSMVIGFLDRVSMQEGFANNLPYAGTTLLNGSGTRTAGDILHACLVNGTYVLEQGNSGILCKCFDPGGTNQLTTDGPSNAGEFYYSDFFEAGGGNHLEIATGGLLQRKGSGEILTTVYDPTTAAPQGGLFTQGVHFYNDQTGAKNDAFLIVDWDGTYVPTNFGKADGLGDPTLRCDAAPIEIGNRVFRDDNRNGIQDPTEPGIAGVAVTLYKSNTLVASATTNADGEYYFSSDGSGTNSAAAIYSLTALTPGSSVQVRINQAQSAIASLSLTAADQGTNDAVDSDFAPSAVGSTTAVANLTLGISGQNVHTLDAGLYACPTITFSAPTAEAVSQCSNTTLNLSVSTTAQAPDQIRLVYFTSPQSGTAIYAGGTVLGTVTSGTLTTNTVSLTNVAFPANTGTANQSYYVYALLVSTAGNCQPSDEVIVTVNPQPIATITGTNQVCSGSQATLVAGTASSYKWYVVGSNTVVSTAQTYSPTVANTTTYGLVTTNASGCSSQTATYTVTAVPCAPCTAGAGKVGGTVYRDFTSDGIKGTNEPGLSGITVQIFACSASSSSSLVTTTTTDINGAYTFSGLTDGTLYRVEFTNLPTGYASTLRGTNNGTSVQFVSSPTCAASLGINQPNDYCQPTVNLVTNCYVNGSVSNGTAPNDVLVDFAYTNSGQSPMPTHLANKSEIGSTWGLGYDRVNKKIYSATFMKRHVGVKDADGNGTPDLGVIYVTDLNSTTATNQVWLDLAKAPYNATVGTIGTDAARGLTVPTAPSNDPTAFDLVGKVGLGDLDLSEDSKTLYVTSLADKKLYAIDVATKNLIGAYTIPDPGCTAGPLRLYSATTDYTDAQGRIWSYLLTKGSYSTNVGGYGQTVINVNDATEGTTDQSVYNSSYYVNANTTGAFSVSVANGTYQVKLHLASRSATEARNFNVTAEGTTVLANYDAYAAANYQSNIIRVQSFTTTVSDGVLSLSVINNTGGGLAFVNAIEITPTGSLASGSFRPFAVAVNQGKVYVGGVCDAQVSQNKHDLRGYVYQLTGSTFTPIFNFPLDYTNGGAFNGCGTGFNPWTDHFDEAYACSDFYVHPQPVLADIEFDVDGSMILGIFDRWGHQTGDYNYKTSGTTTFRSTIGGDVLRVGYINGTYVLENNARVGIVQSSGVNNNQGPGGGEYYPGINYANIHQEASEGGLALLPGSGQVAVTGLDPIDVVSAGIYYLNNTTGAADRKYQVTPPSYNTALFSKANGLGDLELLCDQAPIQIGNRVWRDDNRNGIQDPCEPAIPGAVVTLYNAAKTTAYASVTTNAAGEYYFSSTTITAGNSSSSVATTALTYNSSYALVLTSVGTSTVANGLTVASISPATPGESGTANSGTTQVNNDAMLVNGKACIELTTGGPGSTNHTYDFGLVTCTPPSITALATNGTACVGQSATIYAQVSPAGNYTYVVAGPTGVSLTGANTATAVATGLLAGQNTFTVTVGSSPSCFTTATVSVSAVAPPTITLTSATICAGQSTSLVAAGAGVGATYVFSTSTAVGNVLTVSPILTATYTVTAITSGGCSATTSAQVTVLPKPNAGADQVLVCGPLGATPTATTLSATPVGGTWSNATGNPVTATFTPNSASTTVGNLAAGTYRFVYTVNTCSDTVLVTVPLCQTFCATISATATVSSATVTTGSSATLTANVSPAGSYTYAWSGPAGITLTPTNTASVTTAGLPAGVNTFTVTVTTSPGCFTTATVSVTALTPTLALTVTPASCQTATNQYSVSGTISLSTAVASTLTIVDGTSTTTVSVTAGQTSASFSLTGLTSGTDNHTVTVSGNGYSPISATYSAPASCTIGVSLAVTPGACNTATNQYSISGTVSLTNAIAGTAMITDGSSTTTVSVSAGATSVPYVLGGLTSGTNDHTVTVSYAGQTASLIYAAPASCTLGVAFLITPGTCQSATNQYTLTGTLSLTNASAGNATFTDGSQSSVVSVSAGQATVSFSLTGLPSGTGSHTVTASFNGQTQTQVYTAPLSCTVGVALSVTPGACSSATNQYSLSGSLSLTNAVAGTATLTDGAISTTVAVSTGNASVPFSLSGLPSGTSGHIVTVSYVGQVASATYTAPLSCSVAPALALAVTPGSCNSATNAYAITATISLTAAVTSTLTLSDGSTSTTLSVTAGQSIASTSLTGLSSGSGLHIITLTGTGYMPVSTTYSAPASCSVAPALALRITPGTCLSATNTYDISGTVSLTASVASQLTISDGASTTTVSVTAGQASANFSFTRLTSGSGEHIVTVSGPGYAPVSTTYNAPVSCTVCSLSVVTTSLPNGQVGAAYSQPVMASGGTTPYAFTLTGGSLPAGLTLSSSTGVISGTPTSSTAASFSLLVSDVKNCTALTPLTIITSPAPVCSLTATVTPGQCNTATNQYSITGTVSATNAMSSQSLTISVGTTSTLVTLTGNGPVSYTLTGLNSDGQVKTLTVVSSATACGVASVTYTAPMSCTVAPASLGDYVFADNNKNGVQDTGDSPIPGVVVTLLDGTNTPIASTTTGATGLYSFTGLTPGVPYSVSFTTPVNYTATTPLSGTDKTIDSNPVGGVTTPVTLTSGENNTTIDAGFYLLPASLGDFVFEDSNHNGQQNTGEPGLPNVSVSLLSGTTVVGTTTTDNKGVYSFTGLTPGIPYSVSFTAPAGYSATVQNVGPDATDSDGNPATGLTGTYSLTANEFNPTVDMGYYRPASLGDYVFMDTNKNGVQDAGDTPIPGVLVTLLDGSNTPIASTTTNTNGLYSFTGLTPGIPYSVSFTTPANLSATTAKVGSDATKDSDPVGGVTAPVTLTSGENNTTMDAGFYQPLGSIGSTVTIDLNKNGQRDPNEPGVDGVTVRLLRETTPGNYTVVSTTVTAGGGHYLFTDLPAGTYVVEFVKSTLPANYSFTTSNAPGVPATMDSDANVTTGRTVPLTIIPGNPTQQDLLTVDAGIIDTSCPPSKCVPLVLKQTSRARRISDTH